MNKEYHIKYTLFGEKRIWRGTIKGLMTTHPDCKITEVLEFDMV